MKFLRMKIDNYFEPGDQEKKPLEELVETSVLMRDVERIVPFEKQGETFLRVTMKDQSTFHALSNIVVETVRRMKGKTP